MDLNQFHDKIRSVFGNKIQLKEIVAAFHGIDLESDDFLNEKSFVYAITSALNRLTAQSNVGSKRNFDEINQNSQFQRSNLSVKKSMNNLSVPNNRLDVPESQSFTGGRFIKEYEI